MLCGKSNRNEADLVLIWVVFSCLAGQLFTLLSSPTPPSLAVRYYTRKELGARRKEETYESVCDAFFLELSL